MAKITEIYHQYKILPALAEHHFRVAAVAKQICDNLSEPTNQKNIIKACLIHDMGNIIKFDLTKFPQYMEPEGIEYWQKVKSEFIRKYGKNEHHASVQIARELGTDKQVVGYIDRIGFSLAGENQKNGDINVKICAYADMRVGPHGVMILSNRLKEGKKRYAGRKGFSLGSDAWEGLAKSLVQMEQEIFASSSIQPQDITDGSIKPIVKQLSTYEI